jgi:hypothetical protein
VPLALPSDSLWDDRWSDRNGWSAVVADDVADVLVCAGLLWIAKHLC